MNLKKNLNEYLKKLKKEDLIKIINYFHQLCEINDYPKALEIIKEKKELLIDYIIDLHDKYVKFFLLSLDVKDYNLLKRIIKKESIIDVEKDLIEHLNNVNILFENEMPIETFDLLKKYLKNKKNTKIVKDNKKYFDIASGIILAYGVVSIDTFKHIINSEKYYNLIDINYKKDYTIEKNKVVSNKLSNKAKINKYLKNEDLKLFKKHEFLALGKNIYHHQIKAYKKLIKLLKKNYIFKNYDIIFVDKMIITPYLYNSIAEEDIAREKLIKDIEDYFEFNNQKLKDMMLKNIIKVKEEFPVWEYRGKSSIEVM